jgi:hypothetical protein
VSRLIATFSFVIELSVRLEIDESFVVKRNFLSKYLFPVNNELRAATDQGYPSLLMYVFNKANSLESLQFDY